MKNKIIILSLSMMGLFISISPFQANAQWAWGSTLKSDTIGSVIWEYNSETYSENDTMVYYIKFYCGPKADRFDREISFGSKLDSFEHFIHRLIILSDSFKTDTSVDSKFQFFTSPDFKISNHGLEMTTYNNSKKCIASMNLQETSEFLIWINEMKKDNLSRPRRYVKKKK